VFIVPQQSPKPGKNARKKYSVYTVVRICGFEFDGVMVKIPKYRKVLGENIRVQRRKLGWSQIKLAEKADLHHNYIGDVERGEENVSVDALMRIATALKAQLSDLVQGV
jgi:ribosome-binding protein aMBF1 (putative translation factor)